MLATVLHMGDWPFSDGVDFVFNADLSSTSQLIGITITDEV